MSVTFQLQERWQGGGNVALRPANLVLEEKKKEDTAGHEEQDGGGGRLRGDEEQVGSEGGDVEGEGVVVERAVAPIVSRCVFPSWPGGGGGGGGDGGGDDGGGAIHTGVPSAGPLLPHPRSYEVTGQVLLKEPTVSLKSALLHAKVPHYTRKRLTARESALLHV